MPARVLQLAGPADCEELLAWLARFNAESEYPFDAGRARGALGELLARPELGRVYRIVEGGACAGYVALTLGFSLEWGGRDAFVDEIYLDPAWRGRGLARAALAELLDEARALGVNAVHLEVEPDNAPAQSLYRHAGFTSTGRHLYTHRLR